jgi:hypothetical protein
VELLAWRLVVFSFGLWLMSLMVVIFSPFSLAGTANDLAFGVQLA